MYSCRQCCTEILQTIERNGGISFELQLAVTKRNPRGEYTLQTWILFPLNAYSQPPFLAALESTSSSSPAVGANCRCRSFHLSFKIQSEQPFRWWGDGGPASLTRTLFTMLAKFLLRGPLGLNKSLPKDSDEGCMWDIDTLAIDVVGIGTTYADPVSGRLCTVPSQAVEHCRRNLGRYLSMVCCTGALAKRVRIVRLLVEGEVKQEWFIEQGTGLHEATKKEWARYGWIIEGE
ncbi:hypothetical protein GYMLUDRAFT_38620 [Collybiopsis luxurians FD-317 M1]|nr:hypothetical protein GYMLUDRAFT_38620 [Collybiopsis luxurians FD-317 M1]